MGRSKESLQITWLRELGGTSQELQRGPLLVPSGHCQLSLSILSIFIRWTFQWYPVEDSWMWK